uniref:Macoilin 1a n=1 Tax=Hucho hucho TaxID=62062 RepID=A0A4W5JY84_9TELE
MGQLFFYTAHEVVIFLFFLHFAMTTITKVLFVLTLFPSTSLIGYPVVTLGFGFKSYVSYKMRLRKQKEVQKENEFYMQLLQQALPPEQQMLQRQEREAEEAAMAKGLSSDVDPTPPVSQNGSTPGKKTPVNASVPLPELEYREKGRDGNSKEREGKQQQLQQHTMGINNNSILHTLDSTLQETEYMENIGGKRLNNDLGGGEITHTGNTHTLKEEVGGTGGGKNYKNASGGGVATNSSPRNHSATNGTVPSPGSSNKNEKKTKSAGKGGANQKDPVENCIPNNQLGKPDALVRLEQDVKRLKADLQEHTLEAWDKAMVFGLLARCRGSSCFILDELRKYKENEKDMEVLMSALSAMQDKTQHLENSLSAETRIKLDLFSALGDAKRQLEIAQGQIHQRDQEIAELKQKIAEVMAVMPSISYSNDSSSLSPVTPHYSSKFMDNSSSSLDPNASVYQPLKK